VNAAGAEQDDRVAGRETLAEHEPVAGLHDADARRREIDAVRLDDAAERRGFAAAPRDAAGIARGLPAADEILHPLPVREPFAAARGPVRVHRQRRRAYRDQIVDGHRESVLRDGVVVAAAGVRAHGVGDERLCAETFRDRGDQDSADIDEIGRFAA
jgi:hypothetical protein